MSSVTVFTQNFHLTFYLIFENCLILTYLLTYCNSYSHHLHGDILLLQAQRAKRRRKSGHRSEYVLVNGHQTGERIGTDDISLTNDPNGIFQCKVDCHGRFRRGDFDIAEYTVSVVMSPEKNERMLSIGIRSMNSIGKEIVYNFLEFPDELYCVARMSSVECTADQITILSNDGMTGKWSR